MNRTRTSCTVPGCSSVPVAQGFCFSHYAKLVAKGFGTCAAPGCGSKARHGEFCNQHTKAAATTA